MEKYIVEKKLILNEVKAGAIEDRVMVLDENNEVGSIPRSDFGAEGNGSFTHEQLTDDTTWNIAHNLGNKYPLITVWENGQEVIPKSILAIDLNNTSILFSKAQKGYAVLTGSNFTPTVPSSEDADALSFINAVGTLDVTNQNAIKQLVSSLKNFGLWSKMIAIYPKAGVTATEHKWNLKDPRDLDAAYRKTYSGSWVHSALGDQSNATNTFADTKVNMTTLGMFGNLSLGVYVTVSPTNVGDVYFMGAHSGANNFVSIQRGGNLAVPEYSISSHAYSTSNALVTTSTVKGFVGLSVLGINKTTFYENNIMEVMSAIGSGTANANIYEGCLNLGGRYGSLAYTAGTSWIGYGLTNSEMKNLRTDRKSVV